VVVVYYTQIRILLFGNPFFIYKPAEMDTIRGASEHATKLYRVYSAGAAERGNEEVCRICGLGSNFNNE